LKRLVRHSVVGVLLILSAGVVGLWIRSHYQFDSVMWLKREAKAEHAESVRLDIYSGKGTIEVSWKEHRRVPSRPEYPRWRQTYRNGVGPRAPDPVVYYSGWSKRAWGFGLLHEFKNEKEKKSRDQDFEALKQLYRSSHPPKGDFMFLDHRRSVWFPHWFLAAVLAMPGLRGLWVWGRKRRRARRGLCAGCGYDLRGGGEKCPECGRPLAEGDGASPTLQRAG
jgi:hypothetical protein